MVFCFHLPYLKRGGRIAAPVQLSERESMWQEQMASDNKQRPNTRKLSVLKNTNDMLKSTKNYSGMSVQV